ncbi:39S ribosomal protein L30, mitochondrial [Triplophysa rosa]|uniref:Large ribosomal subunit protein uL30m n=1 Tax=Triplophysa rosa TaxID=992332 RepID=A0A9W8C761_TRIRA|nr:39S ribosomal protein L30, mitochondrial [Triplophysa rosa]KAI7808934.1 39S ribosomal protein L30 [Triplophysa rosa]
MAGLYRALKTSTSTMIKTVTQATSCPVYGSCRTKFTRSRIPPQVFEERAKEHDKYGGDPELPHKLHIVTRVKSTMRRPYWEKKVVKSLGLLKAHEPRVHKNIPSVNSQLKMIKHLVKIQPLKLPYGLPAQEDLANTYLNSRGELVVKRLLKPLEQKALES